MHIGGHVKLLFFYGQCKNPDTDICPAYYYWKREVSWVIPGNAWETKMCIKWSSLKGKFYCIQIHTVKNLPTVTYRNDSTNSILNKKIKIKFINNICHSEKEILSVI